MEQSKNQAIEQPEVQALIRRIITETLAEKDRTVTIRIDADGSMSVSIYPTMESME